VLVSDGVGVRAIAVELISRGEVDLGLSAQMPRARARIR